LLQMNHKPDETLPLQPLGHALTIAGSDACGGAGIQADIKTMTCFGVEAASVLTAITAQNTLGVHGVRTLEVDFVLAQLDAVLDDLPVGAAKTGMLANAGIIEGLAGRLENRRELALVIDPVMVATSGARLLDESAETVLKERLLPLATLLTPNLPEARVLTGSPDDTPTEALAERLLAMGCKAVLIKGGHASGERVEDGLFTPQGHQRYSHPRLMVSVHGTGCALSAAITALLARGLSLEEAVGAAIDWLHALMPNCWKPRKGPLAMLPLAAAQRLRPG
jgi:hydroxymethylpyrimidine/phosphomethylpyrimidine kinase